MDNIRVRKEEEKKKGRIKRLLLLELHWEMVA